VTLSNGDFWQKIVMPIFSIYVKMEKLTNSLKNRAFAPGKGAPLAVQGPAAAYN
jgi:hypothetical protein